jgi:hypothetical protein
MERLGGITKGRDRSSLETAAKVSVKDLKAGEKVTLLCRDNGKGEHQAVTGVKPAPKG